MQVKLTYASLLQIFSQSIFEPRAQFLRTAYTSLADPGNMAVQDAWAISSFILGKESATGKIKGLGILLTMKNCNSNMLRAHLFPIEQLDTRVINLNCVL